MKKINFKDNKDNLIIDILNSNDLSTLFNSIKKEKIQDYIDSDKEKIWVVWYSATGDNVYYSGTFKQLINKIKDQILRKDYKLFFDLDENILNWFEFNIQDLNEKIQKL